MKMWKYLKYYPFNVIIPISLIFVIFSWNCSFSCRFIFSLMCAFCFVFIFHFLSFKLLLVCLFIATSLSAAPPFLLPFQTCSFLVNFLLMFSSCSCSCSCCVLFCRHWFAFDLVSFRFVGGAMWSCVACKLLLLTFSSPTLDGQSNFRRSRANNINT